MKLRQNHKDTRVNQQQNNQKQCQPSDPTNKQTRGRPKKKTWRRFLSIPTESMKKHMTKAENTPSETL